MKTHKPSLNPELEEAGRVARRNGRSARDCPYCYDTSGYMARNDQRGFELNMRAKMDSWMNGWIDENRKMFSGHPKDPNALQGAWKGKP